MNYRPVGNRIIVREVPRLHVGKIVLPANAREEFGPKVWEVIRVGNSVQSEIITPGQRVLAYSHTEGPKDLKDGLKIITEDQVLAVILSATVRLYVDD
jgi:co-chaperonin GroES (HSP10)